MWVPSLGLPVTFLSDLQKSSARLHHLQKWAKNCRQSYLEELFRLDGRGGARFCFNDENEGLYRCLECFDTNLYCAGYILDQHAGAPLHCIEVSTWCFCIKNNSLLLT